MYSLSRFNRAFPYFGNLTPWFDEQSGLDLLKGNEMSLPLVNVLEGIKHYSIELAVPGQSKSDFNIKVDEHSVMTISMAKKETKEDTKDGEWKRKEYNYSEFSRSFTVPATIDIDHITAAYVDGILKIHLPKMDHVAQNAPKQVNIS